MAYKVFTNGSVLQASEVNENLMQQAVATFSNAAARTAAITSPVEGQMTYLEDVDRYDHWNGSAWVSPFGLTRILKETIGTTVTSVVLSNIFSDTYDAYRIIVTGGVSSTRGILRFQLGSAGAGHNSVLIYGDHQTGSTALMARTTNASSFNLMGIGQTTGLYANFEIFNPFPAIPTYVHATYTDEVNTGTSSGIQTGSTSFTGGTLSITAGTMTGGIISVYGYRKG